MATDLLRVYDPPECDERGVPLDWEQCRHCEQSKKTWGKCRHCLDHGSLKAAALDWLNKLRDPSKENRCEDCGHLMSEGTWEGESAGLTPFGYQALLDGALYGLCQGREPQIVGTHYSRCDECRHGGPGRAIYQRDGDTQNIDIGEQGSTPKDWLILNSEPLIEASWRPVEVRTLGWPHDLRPERLAVLCLRCYADREAPRGD